MIDHEGDFTLTLRFTGTEVPEKAKALVAESGLSVKLETGARLSAREVDEISHRASPILDGTPGLNGSGYDPREEVFFFDMAGDPSDEKNANVIADLRATLPTGLPPEYAGARIELSPRASTFQRGGLDMAKASDVSQLQCTTGFVVQNSLGQRGIQTAGHCPDALVYRFFGAGQPWRPLTFAGTRRTPTQDFQWYLVPGNPPMGAWIYSHSETSYSIVDNQSLRSDDYGDYVCHRGMTTNAFSCGTVNSINFDPDLHGGDCNGPCDPVFVRVAGPTLRCYYGDSGGPFVDYAAPHTAYGLLYGGVSTGTDIGDCDYAVFSVVDYFTPPILFY